MTQVSTSGGWHYPGLPGFNASTITGVTLNASGLKHAHIGRVFWDGRPEDAKTISAAGGGIINFRTGAVTFANGGSTIDIGLQNVATGAGPVARPDDSFDVSRTLTGGGGGLITNAWNSVVMTGGSGTIDLTHGDLIAVVWDMTARGGADSVVIQSQDPGSSGWALASAAGFPCVNNFSAAAWGTTNLGQIPNVMLTADDGTIGFLAGGIPISSGTQDTYSDSTNPDERGMLFQVPWDCKVDAIVGCVGITDASSDFTLKLYSSPTSSPQLIASLAVAAETFGLTANQRPSLFQLPAEYSLTKNTNYGVTLLATGSSNARLASLTLGNTNIRKFMPGRDTCSKISRDGSSGNFSAESPALTIYPIGVRISSLDDGTGTGSGQRFIGG